jgi:pilus assembly protein Flp/PilA
MTAGYLSSIKTICQKIVLETTGATAIEYGLIAAGIGVAIIGAVSLVGAALTNTFTIIAAGM